MAATPTPTPDPIVDAKVITIKIGASTMTVDGKSIPLDQPAFVTTDTNRTMLPVHAVANYMSRAVSWNEDTQTVTLTKVTK